MTELVESTCPYCGEAVDIIVDVAGGDRQEYIEDCPVCCQPWGVTVERDLAGEWSGILHTTDE